MEEAAFQPADEPAPLRDTAVPVAPAPTAPRDIRTGRPEAAAAIWNWRDKDAQAPVAASVGLLRRRFALQGLIGAGIGSLLLLLGSRWIAAVALGLSAFSLVAAPLAPERTLRRIQAGIDRLGHVVGVVLTWVLLTPVFYLFFLPFGLLLRRGRRDPLQRRFDPKAVTYWTSRTGAAASPSDYERQF